MLLRNIFIFSIFLVSTASHSNQVALSFDDAPMRKMEIYSGKARTERLLSVLQKYKIQTVFFSVTSNFDTDDGLERMKLYDEAGHFIANHTHTHPNFDETPTDDFIDNFNKAHKQLTQFKNFKAWFRFPMLRHGNTLQKRDAMRAYLHKNKYKEGYVTLDIQDWFMADLVNKGLKEGRKINEEAFRVVEAGEQSVLLVGDYGVGKKSIVNGIAQKMVEEDVPDRLKDKRLVRLNTSSLLAGTTPAGAVERLITMMNEIARAGNIILYINNIQELMGVSAGGEGQSLDVADTLAEYLSKKAFLTIAITTTEAYAQSITNSNFSNIFTSVEIKEMDENQAIQVLESKVGYLEYKQQVFFSYAAIAQAVKLAKRFLHDTYLPGNALEVISEAASLVHTKKGANALVTLEDVAAVVSQKTNIPVTSVSTDESTKLLHLEEELHKRVIGQDEAVTLVANALRRARAEIRSTTRPIANFLFLGPTGVGKTELAKTIAAVYFGGENRMIRLDMSEYQDKSAIYRLIGTPGDKGSGILTEAVRRNAFTLVLLDELEKADKDVLNLFLQVMDDGRLTDSTGRVVDFTNVILIATSNAGTSYVAEQLKQGLSTDAIKDRLLHGELGSYFKPEFLNRFDGIVLFKPLEHEDIKRIAELMLKRVASDLEKKGIELQVEPEALEFFATVGFDPEFGARPLRRALEERVENKLAELVLSKQLQRRSVVVLGQGGEMRVA
jgi:ATP-dependent Clp protease ATP-binding subunit ClpA/peptidoglycan/xylan/chitin deacetylase (PgdA/CDA1 family)